MPTWYIPSLRPLPTHHVDLDLQSYVICEPDAAQVIKTYSPDLMVAPLMRQSDKSYHNKPSAEEAASTIIENMLPRLHVIVCGPGLGRDEAMQKTSYMVLSEARKMKIPFVLDADGLALVTTHPDLVKGCKECVLTPNVVEFSRLAQSVGVQLEGPGGKGGGSEGDCAKVSQALGGVLVIQKGQVDYISNGEETWTCDLEGGKKRSGGQGDTLTGSIAALLGYRKAYLDGIWKTDGSLGEKELLMLAAFGGASITRECSRLAFKHYGRSLQASHVGENVHKAFETIIGEHEASKL